MYMWRRARRKHLFKQPASWMLDMCHRPLANCCALWSHTELLPKTLFIVSTRFSSLNVKPSLQSVGANLISNLVSVQLLGASSSWSVFLGRLSSVAFHTYSSCLLSCKRKPIGCKPYWKLRSNGNDLWWEVSQWMSQINESMAETHVVRGFLRI